MARRKRKAEESVEEMAEQSQETQILEENLQEADSNASESVAEEPSESIISFPEQEMSEFRISEEEILKAPVESEPLQKEPEPKLNVPEPKSVQEKPREKTVEKKNFRTTIQNELMAEYGDAIEWMTAKHEGQTDKNGVPYWTHPLIVSVRVKALAKAAKLDTRTAVLCALLHDIVEDGHASLQEVEYRYGKIVAKIVGILTRDPNLTYMEYIKSIISSGNKTALIVKWADIAHNTSPSRVAKLQEKDRNRLSKKYANARKLIENVYPFLKEMGRKLDQKRKSH